MSTNTANLHVMLDLETMSTRSNAAIISIGAAKFDPNNEDVPFETFSIGVDLESCKAARLDIEGATVMWWLQPERAAAREELLKLPYADLWSALAGFAEWFGEPKPIWGNGASFDNAILSSAYRAAGIDQPWKHWHDRCYRTLKNTPVAKTTNIDFTGLTQHTSLGDAIAQAKHLQKIVKALGIIVE